jgi:hypothetical protein
MFNLTSEYPVKVEGRGRIVDEWKLKPGRDNHFWDCIVGCCVAGSIEGVSLEKSVVEPVQRKPKRKKVYRID